MVELVLESVLQVVPVWVITTNVSLSNEIEAGLDDFASLSYGGTFETWQSAFAYITNRPSADTQVILADEDRKNPSGFRWITTVKETIPKACVVAMMDEEDSSAIESAFKAGVSGYLACTSPTSQIISALMTAASGGIAISPSMFEKIIEIGGRVIPTSIRPEVTKREMDILRLLADGHSVKEIADKLYVSYYTVDMHVRNLHRKFNVKSSRGLVSIALREGMLQRNIISEK